MNAAIDVLKRIASDRLAAFSLHSLHVFLFSFLTTGAIPEVLWELLDLETIDLSHNSLVGEY